MIPINQLGFDKLPNCKTTDWKLDKIATLNTAARLKRWKLAIAYSRMVTRVKLARSKFAGIETCRLHFSLTKKRKKLWNF